MNKKLRVLLADDHEIVLQGLRSVLSQPEFEVVGSVGDGLALVAESKALQPDVIVTDITMPLLNGLDAARNIRRNQPKMKIVFLTMHSEIGYATEAMALGNSAYVLKSAAADELAEAIHHVQRGELYISPRIEATVTENLRRSRPGKTSSDLSAREREILQLIAEGKTFKEIASLLGISPRTVEFHRNRIADKTGRRTMADLTRYAVRLGIVEEKGPGVGGVKSSEIGD
jgi:DNA-binding NarL/FixJ family response regulator